MSNIVFEAKKHNKFIKLLEILALFAFAIYCMLTFGKFLYWHSALYSGFGPELKDLKIEYLDRNNNGKFDTLKFTYKLTSNVSLIGFGGTTICVGDEFRSFSCKYMHLDFPDPQTDTSGHELICKGDNTYVRYLYLNKVPHLTGKESIVTISIIGDNPIIMRRAVVLPSKIDFSRFEALTLGKEWNNYPDYVSVFLPVENKTLEMKNSCRCQFDNCINTNAIELNTNQKYSEGLF